MLGEKRDSIVIRAPYQLDGEYLRTFNTKDYYPDRWMIYDHLTEPIDITDLLASKSRIKYYMVQSYCYNRLKQIKRKMKMKI